MREQILYYAVKYQGDYQKIRKALKIREPWQHIEQQRSYVTLHDNAYPKALKALQYPPYILFYEGDISLMNQRCVGIVGSRVCSEIAKNDCIYITKCLKVRYVIVSGLASGIDAFAHQESLDAATIGVIGCGLDIQYPKMNKELYESIKKQHLLISEYPDGVAPFARNFPWRNRIIAALCESIIVICAKIKSGTMHTVNEALILNKEIYCVPQHFLEEAGAGCNLLISQGANILVDEIDVSLI